MDKYEITFKTWDKVAQMYQDKFMDMDLYNDSYDAFCDLLTENAHILELGCGPGNITKYLLTKRPDLQLLVTDIAPNMLALAQKNNPTAEFQILDCRKINELERQFDAVLCGFALPYLSQKDCEKLMRDSFELLRKNGLVFLSALEGEYSKSGFETGKTGDQCYVYYHQEKTLKDQMHRSGFEVIHSFRIAYPKGDEIDIHLVLIGRKV
ncbi:MAG: methyltransferase domain-containing protein [Crocinitomix sp.]|nr:methyltransferase domain-containing protein [Crocinitomix sp.]